MGGEVNSYVELFDINGNSIIKRPINALGDNAYELLQMNEENPELGITGVNKIEVYFKGSGSINTVFFCPPDNSKYIGCIGDTIFVDNNKDGIKDANENGVAGVDVVVVEAIYPCNKNKKYI